MADLVSGKSTVTSLDISGNYIEDRGAELLAAAIAKNTGSVVKLNLSWNKLSDVRSPASVLSLSIPTTPAGHACQLALC